VLIFSERVSGFCFWILPLYLDPARSCLARYPAWPDCLIRPIVLLSSSRPDRCPPDLPADQQNPSRHAIRAVEAIVKYRSAGRRYPLFSTLSFSHLGCSAGWVFAGALIGAISSLFQVGMGETGSHSGFRVIVIVASGSIRALWSQH